MKPDIVVQYGFVIHIERLTLRNRFYRLMRLRNNIHSFGFWSGLQWTLIDIIGIRYQHQ